MRRKPQLATIEQTQQIVVGVPDGLSTGPAQRLHRRASEFDCEATIQTPSGLVADARSLLQLLLLGVAAGDLVTVSCRGPGAPSALPAIVEVLRPAPTWVPRRDTPEPDR